MSKRSVAALLAGFGTGYMQGQKQKQDKERQDKKDRADEEDRKLRNEDILLRREEIAAQKSREADAVAGFDIASKMKVGELRNEQGAIDNGTQAWQERIATTPDNEGNLPTAEVAATTAPIYAQEAAKQGAQKWLSSAAPDAILGQVKPTTRGDIRNAQASAQAKLGISGMAQAIAMRDQASELDIKDLQTKILSATSIEDLNEHYKIFPDGYDLKGETDPETGRLKYWYETVDGKKVMPNEAMPQDFASFKKMKEYAVGFVSGNPDYIMQQWENSRKSEREDKAFEQKTKVTEAQLADYAQKIKKGDMELASLPESIQLELKAKKDNIEQSRAATAKSRAGGRSSDDDEIFADWKRKPSNKDKGRDDYAKDKASWGKGNDLDTQTVTEGPALDALGRPILKDGVPVMTRKVTRKERVSDQPAKDKPIIPKNRPPLSTFSK